MGTTSNTARANRSKLSNHMDMDNMASSNPKRNHANNIHSMPNNWQTIASYMDNMPNNWIRIANNIHSMPNNWQTIASYMDNMPNNWQNIADHMDSRLKIQQFWRSCQHLEHV